jgi:hypothetical protein
MYNTDIPSRVELSTSGQLLRSTILAAATAAALLVTTVLPAEYGIDPTGVGGVLGLTQMGEIKVQLAEEAAADRAADQGTAPPATPAPEQRSSLDAFGTFLAQLVVRPAAAEPASIVLAHGDHDAPPSDGVYHAPQSDETTVTLRPGEGLEVKMEMNKGAQVIYAWKAEGGTVNYDTHGEPYNAPNATHSYSKGRGVAGDVGLFQAAFDGKHGWFWRNRGSQDVTVTLTTSGDYTNLKRLK